MLSPIGQLVMAVLIPLLHTISAPAQPLLIADGDVQTIEALEETYQDFIVPNDATFGQFNLEIEGADGGSIEYSYLGRFGAKRTQRVNGGEGASATYSVGKGSGQVSPGAILRFIIGNRGERAKFDLLSHGGYGAGGGGGAGVATKEIDTQYNPGLPGYSGDDGRGFGNGATGNT